MDYNQKFSVILQAQGGGGLKTLKLPIMGPFDFVQFSLKNIKWALTPECAFLYPLLISALRQYHFPHADAVGPLPALTVCNFDTMKGIVRNIVFLNKCLNAQPDKIMGVALFY